MDYAISEFIYMLPSDMNLQIGNVRNYNNKMLISSPALRFEPMQRSISMVKRINQMSSQRAKEW